MQNGTSLEFQNFQIFWALEQALLGRSPKDTLRKNQFWRSQNETFNLQITNQENSLEEYEKVHSYIFAGLNNACLYMSSGYLKSED